MQKLSIYLMYVHIHIHGQKQVENGLQLRSGCHGLSWMTFMDDFYG